MQFHAIHPEQKRNSTGILPILYYEFFVTTNNFLQPGQNYSKMYGSEPRFNKILVIMNTIHKRKRKIYLNIMNKCQHAIKDECQTDQQG